MNLSNELATEPSFSDIQLIKEKCVNLFEVSNDERLEALHLLFILSRVEFEEILNIISSLFFFSNLSSIKEYIKEISKYKKLPLYNRINFAKYLFLSSPDTTISIIQSYFMTEFFELLQLDLSVLMELFYYLLNHSVDHEENKSACTVKYSLNFFLPFLVQICNDNRFPEKDRYGVIKNITKKVEIKAIALTLQYELICFFIQNVNISVMYRLLSLQNYFQTFSLDTTFYKESEIISYLQLLQSFTINPNINENVQADACDIILHATESLPLFQSYATEAKTRLMQIGKSNNIYKNTQNVHFVVQDTFTHVIDLLKKQVKKMLLFEDITKEWIEKTPLITLSLQRIIDDNAKYGKSQMTLQDIFCTIYSFIQESKYKEEMTTRLIEELMDATNTCSTGYLRMVNVLYGFEYEEFELPPLLTYQQQITANLEGRLNKLIREEQDEKKQELLLSEMTIDSGLPEKRKNFLQFFIQHVPRLKEQLYTEFIEYLQDNNEFELYFKNALLHYFQ